ncbi:MAG: hypothetical protein GXO32_05925 [Crenarchaeota archaeon]|nr:hypothetical protein [Thermoproteota archaeon]
MSLLEGEFESIAILDLDGEVLDYVGSAPESSLVKEVTTIAFLASRALGMEIRRIELDSDRGKLVVLIDPPLVRVALVRDRR